MARADATKLAAAVREPSGSRATRRLRAGGRVPGIVYGGGGEPVPFDVDARELRVALAASGAIIDLVVDGAGGQPVLLKDQHRHPVTGEVMHLDLLRIRLDERIETAVPLELTGADDSPGVRDGGVLEQVTRELRIDALPTAIPDSIVHDVSGIEVNETVMLSAVTAPEGVALLDDLAETVVATCSPPRLVEEPEEEIEEETELVGEGEAAEREAAAGEAAAGEAAAEGDGE